VFISHTEVVTSRVRKTKEVVNVVELKEQIKKRIKEEEAKL
jgi:hypothetical protein